MLSQADTILQALKNNPNGCHPTLFIEDLHIFQYSARIHELRTRFGCQCKNGNDVCFAKEHIRNYDLPNGTTLFKYMVESKVDFEKIREETIEKQREQKQTGLF